MKKTTLKNRLSVAMLILAGTVYSQDNIVLLTSLPTGSEANSLTEDTSTFNISALGVVTDTSLDQALVNPKPDWGITSTGVNLADALGKDFSMKMKPALVIDQTPGTTYGAITTLGGIDRAGDGALGIRPVSGTANWGIDGGEGFVFGFNISNLTSAVTLQITKISFSTFTGATETAVIVNRQDTSKLINVSQVVNGSNPTVDVSSLGLYVTGGASQLNMVSIFNNTNPVDLITWRVTKLEFKLVDTATLGIKDNTNNFSNRFVVSQNPVSEVISIDYDSTALQNISASLIDINGRIIENKSSKNAVNNKILFEGSSLKSGVYFVKISNETNSVTKKILKK